MLSISKAVLREELNLAQRILTKWQEKLEAGIPGVDFPVDDMAFDSFLREAVGELMVVSGKLENIATLLSEDRSG
jgi:hypothetical protein